jgi:hypothetical protein
MPAPTASIFGTKSSQIREVLSKGIIELMPTLDPVFTKVVNSARGVSRSDQIGRDHLVVKHIRTGVTGVIDGAANQADFPLYGDDSNVALGPRLHTQSLTRTFPNPLEGPNQTAFRMAFGMRAMLGNIMLTLGEMTLDNNPEFIDEHIMPKISGFAMNMAQMNCNYWWLSQNNFYALTSVVGAATTGFSLQPNSGGRVLVLETSLSNWAVHRFFTGQRVQFYAADGSVARRNGSTGDSVFVVVAHDEMNGKVFFRSINNQVLSTASGSGRPFYDATIDSDVQNLRTTDICVFANTVGSSSTPFAASPWFVGFAGPNSWMKYGDADGTNDSNDNCLLGRERPGTNSGYSGNINVNVHPEFRSLLWNNSGNALTEHQLRKILRAFHAAKKRYGYDIDTLVASEGVWLAYEAQQISREWIDRTSRLSSVRSNQGSDNEENDFGMQFTFDGRTIKLYTSNWVESNTAYGLKMGGGNWKRYMPPGPKGIKKFDKSPAYAPFEFVGRLLNGTDSDMIPISRVSNNLTQTTEGTSMPCWQRMQFAPDQIPGLKITGLAEDRLSA